MCRRRRQQQQGVRRVFIYLSCFSIEPFIIISSLFSSPVSYQVGVFETLPVSFELCSQVKSADDQALSRPRTQEKKRTLIKKIYAQ